MLSSHQQLGKFGEDLAASFLQNKGYKIVRRNYRQKWGEIDLIAIKYRGFILKRIEKYVFVEVKTLRRNESGILPEDEVTPWKQQRIIRTAETYLIEKGIFNSIPWQIDVIAIEVKNLGEKPIVRHWENVVWGNS